VLFYLVYITYCTVSDQKIKYHETNSASLKSNKSNIYNKLEHLVNIYKLYNSSKCLSKHIQTEEREAARKQGLNEKTAASVLLKLFISGNEMCHTTDAP